MCGIVGYVGRRPARELLLAGLKRLEYRGYDSAGISVIAEDRIEAVRAVGNLDALQDKMARLGESQRRGSGPAVAVATPAPAIGIGHTRWATHGRVSEDNAHPHFDSGDRVHVVVNGIVENYMALKQRLREAGSVFTSETDAEVIAHLIAGHYAGDLADAVRAAYLELEGHYAFVAMCLDEPQVLVGARKECPLIVGRGDGEQFIASAVPAFLAQTREVQYVENGDIVVLTPEGVTITSPQGDVRSARCRRSTGMRRRLRRAAMRPSCSRRSTNRPTPSRKRSPIVRPAAGWTSTTRVRWRTPSSPTRDGSVIVACGTAYHAGLIGRYAIEEWARVPVETDIASEYRYRNPVVGPGTW